MKTRTVAVIPARYGATRLPGKPLLDRTGRPMIQHVYEQVRRARRVDRILIATDDRRILRAAEKFGAEAVLTSRRHPNGTSRCWEAVARIPCERVLNVQGDEPEIEPELIDRTAELLEEAEMSTVATTHVAAMDALKPQRVKVVLDGSGHALYFSRSRIPSDGPVLLHFGLYGYRKKFLRKILDLPATPLSDQERLEQLKVLEHGHRIRVGVVDAPCRGGIDTPEDYEEFVRRWNASREARPAAIARPGARP